MFRVLRSFLGDLFQGDPVALTCAAVLAGIALVVCLLWWKSARDQRREDEEWKRRRYGGGKKKP